MEVRLNGCSTTCHPGQLLRKTVNRFALLGYMQILSHWRGDSIYHHLFHALILGVIHLLLPQKMTYFAISLTTLPAKTNKMFKNKRIQ